MAKRKNEQAFAMLYQDPFVSEEIGRYEFNRERDFLLGSASSRFVVRDEDANGYPLYGTNDWNVPSNTYDNFMEYSVDSVRDTPQFHQVNVFAVCAHTLEFVEAELGREIAWANGRPLIIRPHAFEEANAYYDPEDVSLSFGYFYTPFRDRPVWLCLSHDVISHELGHAILDAFRPIYNYSAHPDTHAFHESFADILAMFSAIEHEDVVKNLFKSQKGSGAKQPVIDLAQPNVITDLAEEFGAGFDGASNAYLRSALNDLQYGPDLSIEPHERSEAWTGAMYAVLVALAKTQNRHSAHPISQTGDDSLAHLADVIDAVRHLKGFALRTLNHLPPTGLALPTLARLILKADELVFGKGDARTQEERQAVNGVFKDRGLLDINAVSTNGIGQLNTAALRNIWETQGREQTLRDVGDATVPITRDLGVALATWISQHADALQIPTEWDVTLGTPVLTLSQRNIDSEKEKKIARLEAYLQYSYSITIMTGLGPLELYLGYTLVLRLDQSGMKWTPALLVGEDEIWDLQSGDWFPIWMESYAEFDLDVERQLLVPKTTSNLSKRKTSRKNDAPPEGSRPLPLLHERVAQRLHEMTQYVQDNALVIAPEVEEFDSGRVGRHPMSGRWGRHPMSSRWGRHPMSGRHGRHPIEDQEHTSELSGRIGRFPNARGDGHAGWPFVITAPTQGPPRCQRRACTFAARNNAKRRVKSGSPLQNRKTKKK